MTYSTSSPNQWLGTRLPLPGLGKKSRHPGTSQARKYRRKQKSLVEAVVRPAGAEDRAIRSLLTHAQLALIGESSPLGVPHKSLHRDSPHHPEVTGQDGSIKSRISCHRGATSLFRGRGRYLGAVDFGCQSLKSLTVEMRVLTRFRNRQRNIQKITDSGKTRSWKPATFSSSSRGNRQPNSPFA